MLLGYIFSICLFINQTRSLGNIVGETVSQFHWQPCSFLINKIDWRKNVSVKSASEEVILIEARVVMGSLSGGHSVLMLLTGSPALPLFYSLVYSS